jgi:brefeldin A-inhibited guanine nucleotide-exchange protein
MHTGVAKAQENDVSDEELSHVSIRARTLALELLLSVLGSAGAVLREEDVYVGLVRNHLCMSIARNGGSVHPGLFELSISLMIVVVGVYRSRLVQECEILINTVYIHILEMGNSTFVQKELVLRALERICRDAQIVIDLFVNYDCDLGAVSIFERIVNVCARCAQGGKGNSERSDAPEDGNWNTPVVAPVNKGIISGIVEYVGGTSSDGVEQERRIKLRALNVLVAIVESLVEWSSEEGRVVADKYVRLSRESADGKEEDDLNPFLEAIVPTNQNNPVLVNGLSSVTLVNSRSSAGLADEGIKVEERATRKQLLRQALKLFEKKPNKGVKAFVEAGFCDGDCVSVAKFISGGIGLDKSALGEFLGDHGEFNVKVMHAFIDGMTFEGVAFVEALRDLLASFRLPGEAQKIDRIMEKFADRYCDNNPDIFAKADTAYTLAYSIIMLNTDQHSSKIRHRMDLAAFIKNNRGINDSGNLPDALLTSIFEDIGGNEIVMEDEQAGKFAELAKGWGAGELENDEMRMDLYRKEISLIQKKSQLLIRAASGKREERSVFKSAGHADLARPMFAMASWAMMATFSILFDAAIDDQDEWDNLGETETIREEKIADLCLRGFEASIRVASLFKMETERDAFVGAMAKLTGLGNVGEMKPKNVKAIKGLIGLCGGLGEWLDGSWVEVLKVVSAVERLQSSGIEGRKSVDGRRGSIVESPGLSKILSELGKMEMDIAIDGIFTRTVKLSGGAIVYFFKALCIASLEEVGLENSEAGSPMEPGSPIGKGPPRM